MNKVVAATAGLLLAFAPAGTALAGETGSGNAWGNCKNSSAGGVHAPLDGHAGNGNGGLQDVARAGDGADCPRAGAPTRDQQLADLLKDLEQSLGTGSGSQF